MLAAVRGRLDASGLTARAILSHDRLLDVLPERAGKHAALAHVAKVLGLPPDRVIAAGDSGNDADMLAEAAALNLSNLRFDFTTCRARLCTGNPCG